MAPPPQVTAKACMLNSNDVFVLSYDITTYVWYGKGCSTLEMKVGDYIATSIVNKSAPMIGTAILNGLISYKQPHCSARSN